MMENCETMFASVAQAAKHVGVSRYYLRQRIAAGTAPHIYCGRRILVNVPQLVETLAAESASNNVHDGNNAV